MVHFGNLREQFFPNVLKSDMESITTEILSEEKKTYIPQCLILSIYISYYFSNHFKYLLT